NSPDKAFVNGDGPTALLKNVNITDIDSSTIASAQITLNGANSNESLSFVAAGSISGSYDANNHTLTLTGNASISDYQTALEAVQYDNDGSNLTSTTDEIRQFDVTVTDVSVDTTSVLSSAVGNGSLTLFGEFTNIQQYADNTINPLAQEPTEAHYQALGFETALDDGYFSSQRTALNNTLRNDNPALQDLSALQAYIDTDTDKDGMRDYFDPDVSLVNESTDYLLHPEYVGNLPSDTNNIYSYLYKVHLKFSNSTETLDYVQVATWAGSDDLSEDYRWPKYLNMELNNRFSTDGLNATTDDSSSSNTVDGVDWMEVDYITEWWTIIDYIISDSNQKPELADFAAIGIENVGIEHVNELRSLVSGVQNAKSYDEVKNRSNSYVIIHDYAIDSGNPITATAPQSTDYTNIGLTQDVSSVSEFNAWLNDTQLVVVTDISAMVNVINHAKNIAGASAPAETDYTQAGITGVDAS
ncbi:hypothetical protein, partial [Vibrio thalassae]